MIPLKEVLEQFSDLIGEPYRDKNGRLTRMVDGKEIGQIEEKTPEDVQRNRNINLWRMRNKLK